jgi:hypothetical protein
MVGCTPNPSPRPTETSASPSALVASAPVGPGPSSSGEPAAPGGSAGPSASALAGSSAGSGGPEAPDAGLPDCTGVALEGEVLLPPSEAGMLSNAATDASVDRSYPELSPALRRALPGLRCCYTAARKAGRSLAGGLVVELRLAPDGKVKSVSQARDKSDINDPMLGSCVETTLSEVSFPASRRGQATVVVLPLVFRAGVR